MVVGGTVVLDHGVIDRPIAPAACCGAPDRIERTHIRVAVLGFHHESNTFAPVAASLERFLTAGPVEGDELLAQYGESQATLAGFIEAAAADPDVELVPLVYFDLQPDGHDHRRGVRHARRPDDRRSSPSTGRGTRCCSRCTGRPCRRCTATSTARSSSGCAASWATDVPIGVTFDMHANVSARMIETADRA